MCILILKELFVVVSLFSRKMQFLSLNYDCIIRIIKFSNQNQQN